jgi:NAD(P)H-dependent FMN reductase
LNDKKTALLIMGSVRAGRVCHQVAQWVADLGHASAQLDVEIVP